MCWSRPPGRGGGLERETWSRKGAVLLAVLMSVLGGSLQRNPSVLDWEASPEFEMLSSKGVGQALSRSQLYLQTLEQSAGRSRESGTQKGSQGDVATSRELMPAASAPRAGGRPTSSYSGVL